ncbi:hypothetical protein AVEN_254778-1 [Araneus ventricosus]|uniref:Uncharacterized protein n=1 Tax=Araneus ventricosus TaxID=182803 RepID=A0A4Y2G9Z7_ARAVE|nr:hypothetical protein AVEN_254778-1 [Araneus ventricosus]
MIRAGKLFHRKGGHQPVEVRCARPAHYKGLLPTRDLDRRLRFLLSGTLTGRWVRQLCRYLRYALSLDPLLSLGGDLHQCGELPPPR